MRSLLLIAASAAWIGCTDLKDIAPDECGNNVLEPGEDCDGFVDAQLGANTACGDPGAANQCRYVCDDASDATCPTGWGCGQDGVCRRAAGEVERASGSPWRFSVDDFGIGDVDGDGHEDLVGSGEASLSIRYGTETGEFPTELTTLIRHPQGPPQFGKFDSDDLLDVVIPIFSGIHVMRGQPDGTLLPVAYQPLAFELPDAAVLDEVKMYAIEVNPFAFNTELLILFGAGMELGDEITLPAGITASRLAGDPARADLNVPIPDGRQEFALAFEGTNRVYVYSTTLTPDAMADGGFRVTPFLKQEVALPAGNTIQKGGGVLFADVDGRNGPDLIIGTKGPIREHVAIAYNDGAGNLGAAAVDDHFDSISPSLPLVAADLNGDGKADYVSGDAIYITDFALIPLAGPPRSLVPVTFRVTEDQWANAAVGNFNADEHPDVAVSVAGEEGIDFYFGTPSSLFNKFRVDTDVPPFMLRAGDFDGDFIEDLAFGLTGFTDSPDQVAVIFGAVGGGPSDAVVMGALDYIVGLEPVTIIFDIEGIDEIRDLLVISDAYPDQDAKQVAFLQGSSDRQLLAPFTLQAPDSEGSGLHVPQRVLVGNFANLDDGQGGDQLDILAVAQPQSNFGNTDTATPAAAAAIRPFYMWLLPSNGPNAELSALDASFKALEDMDFETRCGQWTSGDLNKDGIDEIIGLDGTFRCYGFGNSPQPKVVVANVEDVDSGVKVQELDLGGDFLAADRMEMKDLDADGDQDLVVLFRGESRPGAGTLVNPGEPAMGSGVVVAWNVDGQLVLNNLSWYDVPDVYRMYDVAPIHLVGDDEIPELVMLTDAGIYYAQLDSDTSQYETIVKLLDDTSEGRLRTGDVNGDGLDDLAFTDGFGNIDVYLGREAAPLGGVVSDAVAIDEEGGQ